VLLLAASRAPAAEPEVQAINVRGLQVGGTTAVTIDGDKLGPNPKLLLPFAAKPALKAGSTDKKLTFDVALDDTVTPGYHHLRVVTDGGISLPILVGVDRLVQQPLGTTIAQLPAAVTGVVAGSNVAETTFTGKVGQKVQVEVEAQRLGSKLRPVAHLYNAKRLQLAWSWPNPTLLGDTRLEATLPADGTYTIAIHDVEYAPPGPAFFRLKVGQWSYADQVFPPVVGKDAKSVELLGASPVKVDLPVTRTGAISVLPWPRDGSWSGLRPVVEISDRTEILGQAPTGKPQDLPTGPIGVSGRLSAPYEEHRYRLMVTPNRKVKLEIFAERIGSPIDVALVVRNDTGADLVRVEDGTGTLDPALEYAVPDKVTAIQVAVVDAQGLGSPKGIYHLKIDPAQATAAGDFHLFTPSQRVVLPVGGKSILPVFGERKGYNGPITISADGLPPGTKLEGAVIPAGADGTLVTVNQTAAAPAAISNWKGRGDNGIERPVALRGHALERLQPWLATELAIAPITAKVDEFAADFKNLPADKGLVPTVKLSLPVTVKRPDPNTIARLTLLTSQAPPMLNGQPNPGAAIRVERPIELGAKISDGEVPVLLPTDLPADSYDFAIQAEVLSADRRTVLATVFTPVRKLPVKLPVALKLSGPATIAATPDAKMPTTVEVAGQVERKDGFKDDVALAVTGLPPGLRADAVTVKAGTDKFTVKIVVPPGQMPGEIKGLKLNGTFAPDPKQAAQRIKSRDVELTLNIQPGKK
jgi:hypothetical protein